jgi:hypothetical protein
MNRFTNRVRFVTGAQGDWITGHRDRPKAPPSVEDGQRAEFARGEAAKARKAVLIETLMTHYDGAERDWLHNEYLKLSPDDLADLIRAGESPPPGRVNGLDERGN